MQIFYSPKAEKEHQNIVLNEIESQHLVQVLRKKPDDIVQICNGIGSMFNAKITRVHKKKTEIELTKLISHKKTPLKKLHIGIAPTKNISRFDFFIEKAVEFGITEISPIICDNSERKLINENKIELKIIGAMKQSGMLYKPTLHSATTLKQFIKKKLIGNKYIAHCENNQRISIEEIDFSSQTTILIGPEGDFSSNEISLALNENFQALQLGQNRLRTETAGIYSTAVFYSKSF